MSESKEEKSANRRRDARYPLVIGLPCVLISVPPPDRARDLERQIEARTEDISHNGLGISIPGLIPVGSILQIQLPQSSGGSSIETVQGKVVWCKSLTGKAFRAGIELIAPSFRVQEIIEDLIKKLTQE